MNATSNEPKNDSAATPTVFQFVASGSISLVLFLSLASSAVSGATIMDVGRHELLPDTRQQEIKIYVQGTDHVQGLNFRIQVADGGPFPPLNGSILGPRITNVDLVAGTVFAQNNSGQASVLTLPQLWVQTITTDPTSMPDDRVLADGLLATVTFDTTELFAGTFDLVLSDTLAGPTDFAGQAIQVTDGSLHIVPEPTTVRLGIIAMCVFYPVVMAGKCGARRRSWPRMRGAAASAD